MEVQTGMAVIVVLIKVNLLLWCISLPFQIGNLPAALSNSGWRAIFGSFVTDNRIPKYLIGKSVV
jgi:hypothetical protein